MKGKFRFAFNISAHFTFPGCTMSAQVVSNKIVKDLHGVWLSTILGIIVRNCDVVSKKTVKGRSFCNS